MQRKSNEARQEAGARNLIPRSISCATRYHGRVECSVWPMKCEEIFELLAGRIGVGRAMMALDCEGVQPWPRESRRIAREVDLREGDAALAARVYLDRFDANVTVVPGLRIGRRTCKGSVLKAEGDKAGLWYVAGHDDDHAWFVGASDRVLRLLMEHLAELAAPPGMRCRIDGAMWKRLRAGAATHGWTIGWHAHSGGKNGGGKKGHWMAEPWATIPLMGMERPEGDAGERERVRIEVWEGAERAQRRGVRGDAVV